MNESCIAHYYKFRQEVSGLDNSMSRYFHRLLDAKSDMMNACRNGNEGQEALDMVSKLADLDIRALLDKANS